MADSKKTIKDIIIDINAGKIYLPAIQRKYVWKDTQITRLMDSIMLDYPIATFLFWKVKKDTVNKKQYSMYEFIKDYHERDMYKNPDAPQPFPIGNDDETIWAVLDGQQRLTSLYIALQGSMARKLPNKRWNNDDAFIKKKLYFNLHSEPNDDDGIAYEFKFLTEDEAKDTDSGKLWYLVKDILKYSFEDLLNEVIVPNGWITDTQAIKNLNLLYTRFVKDDSIIYFEVKGESIDNVLDIFVRVNSGGTVLSKSDLLFSTIVSHWDHAREEIDSLLTEINKKGEGFRFSNDFIMRTCLYVTELPVALKVETFKKQSVENIRDNWGKIRSAITTTVDFLCDRGFSYENILSYVAIIPIVYYFYRGGKSDASSCFELNKYIVSAQLKQVFGAATNTALKSIREALQLAPKESFHLDSLKGIRFTGDRNLKFTSEEVDSLFDSYEIGAYTFMILSLLYKNLKFSQKSFHQDHMHPQISFEEKNIKSLVLPDGDVIDKNKQEEWRRKRNTLANLQIMEGKDNARKNDTPLNDWLKIPGNKDNAKYLPQNISYDLSNFDQFMEERQKLMSQELKKILL